MFSASFPGVVILEELSRFFEGRARDAALFHLLFTYGNVTIT